MIRIAINGCGRIGRCIVRALYEGGYSDQIELVALNDLGDIDLNCHLIKWDSSHGVFDQNIECCANAIKIQQKNIRYFSERDPTKLPWKELDVDIALECTGVFKKREQVISHLDAGAKKVLVSHPLSDADMTVVYGVNHDQISGAHKLVSNASCTTNCLAPLVKIVHDAVVIQHGLMTTIHAYTNDQSLLDKAPGDYYRSRSATQSIIPTKTGAASAVGLVIPELSGKLDGMALRVPTANVSLIDLHCVTQKKLNAAALNELIRASVSKMPLGVLDVNELPLVSVDFNHNAHSCVVDLSHTNVIGNQIKLMAWYDNEWGFANRMLDMVKVLGSVGY